MDMKAKNQPRQNKEDDIGTSKVPLMEADPEYFLRDPDMLADPRLKSDLAWDHPHGMCYCPSDRSLLPM